MQTTPERPEPALRHRFDIDDYYRMADAGILSGEDRVELIELEIVDLAPSGSAHNGTTDFLSKLVARAFAEGQVDVRVQGSLRLDRLNEPQPDLMLLSPRAAFYSDSHPTAADVLLLVEVADNLHAYDRGPRLTLYGRHGVPEAWLVDLINRAAETCREPGTNGYADRRRVTAGEALPPSVFALADLLG